MVELSAHRVTPRSADRISERSGVLAYIPEIDGLRAFAVLSVMLYHLNPSLLAGGFVGVDIFFVISGYVVTASLWRDVDRPFASMILQFYARRVLRIIPALIVCLVVTAAATVLFIPDSWLSSTTQKTALFAFFGISNFALFDADAYFSPQIEFNPFAHTWTLAVEEQFYLLLPAVIYFSARSRHWPRVWRFLGRYLLPILSFISIFILTLNNSGDQRSNFYLLPGRFWELGIGALLFQLQVAGKTGRLSSASKHGLLIAGTVSMACAVIFADRHAFPFPWAIPAALGSLSVIAVVSHNGIVESPIINVLRTPTITAIGKISYSLYLWHWSVYAIFRWTVGMAGVVPLILAFGLSFLLAYLSYAFVEEPIRHGRRILALPKFTVVAVGLAAVVLGWGAVREGMTDRRSLSLSVVMRSAADWYPEKWPDPLLARGCEVRPKTDYIDGVAVESVQPSCVGDREPPRRLFVIGDSHAQVYYPIFLHLASTENMQVVIYYKTGCGFANLLDPSPSCQNFAATSVADITKKGSAGDLVFLASRRMPYLYDLRGPVDRQEILQRQTSADAAENRRLAYQQAVDLIAGFERRNMRVVMEAPPPVFRAPAFQCSDWFNAGNPVCRGGLSISRDELLEYRQPAMESIVALAKTYPDLVVWDPFPILCPEATCRALTISRRPLFYDGDHISAFANTVLYPSFVSLLHRVQGEAGAAPRASDATLGQELP